MISVIIPVYNASKYLHRVISSILSQSYPDWELILVNDGSTDDSLSICEEFSKMDRRIVVINQINRGASTARNNGMKKANGEFICFVDADDYVSGTYLEELFQDFIFNDQIDLVIQGFTKIYKEKQLFINLPENNVLGSLEELFDKINVFTFCGPCCKLFRSSIIRDKKIYFNSDIVCAEDFDYILRYFLHCRKIKISLSNNYFYESHDGSVSSQLHDYYIEYSSLFHLNESFNAIPKFNIIGSIFNQYCYVISYFVYRVLMSLMLHPISYREDLFMMKQLSTQYGQIFKKHYVPKTKVLYLTKFFFNNELFRFLYIFFRLIRKR